MTALAAVLAMFCSFQEEARLREAWPKLQECWKALDAAKPEPSARLTDDVLKALGRLDAAFEAAGLRDANAPFVSGALRHLLLQRGQRLLPAQNAALTYWVVAGARGRMADGRSPAAALDALLAGVRKLGELQAKGLDDEDNVQDQLTEIRGAMKDMHLVSDATPIWLRRRLLNVIRALDSGAAFPAVAAPTAEDTARLQKLIGELSAEDPATRDQAARELAKSGEQAQALLAEAAKSTDPETSARAKQILGLGHVPWKETASEAAPTLQNAVLELKTFKKALEEDPADDR